jgi:hypothetical protein
MLNVSFSILLCSLIVDGNRYLMDHWEVMVLQAGGLNSMLTTPHHRSLAVMKYRKELGFG